MATYRIDGTTVVLNITDEVADAYHKFQDTFAQIPAEKLTEGFTMEGMTDRELELYDKYATMVNLMCELNGGAIDCSAPMDENIRLIKVD